MFWLKEVGGGMIHVKETQQLLQTIAIFSHKYVSVGMFVHINTPVISSPPVISPGLSLPAAGSFGCHRRKDRKAPQRTLGTHCTIFTQHHLILLANRLFGSQEEWALIVYLIWVCVSVIVCVCAACASIAEKL